MTQRAIKWLRPVGEGQAEFTVELDGHASFDITVPVLKKNPKAPTKKGGLLISAKIAAVMAGDVFAGV